MRNVLVFLLDGGNILRSLNKQIEDKKCTDSDKESSLKVSMWKRANQDH